MIVATLALAISLNPAVWKRYDIGPAQISLELPAPLKRVSDPKEKGIAVWFSDGASSAATVLSFDASDDSRSLETQLASLVFQMSEEPGQQLESMKDEMRQGWPGISVSGKADGMPFRTLAFAFEKRIVSAQVRSASSKVADAAYLRIFSSLKFLPSVSQGTRTVAGPLFQPYPVGTHGLTGNFPGPPRPMPSSSSGFMAQYGGRTYVAMDEPIPANIDPNDTAKLDRFVAFSVRNFVAGAMGEIVTTGEGRIGDLRGAGATFTIKKPRSTGRVVVVRRNGFTFLVCALVPDLMKNSPEVEAFLNSAKIVDPKSP